MHPAVLLNLGYLLNFLALTVKDVLWLRSVLLPAQLSFLAWGVSVGNVAPVVWNIVFLSINTVQIARIVRERRPIELPADLADLHEKVFHAMRRREFLLFWETGTVSQVVDAPLVREGETLEALYFIVSGTARVVKDGRTLATLSRGSFAGELSFLSREPASADVVADGTIEVNSWNQRKLRRLDKIDPELYVKIQEILGRDVTGKIRAASSRLDEPA
jgi:CRP-like cAMP-binding protein